MEYSEEDLAQARQMAARAAVGLSNAQLIEDLDQHNWETLVTLARAIDASSPWTLGHSERGADLAVSIGRQMGLSDDELVHLHRGALLHDIGKLAIDRSVLDKQGVLTEEERQIMREHPRKGARILSAHRSYAKAIPVVEQHHECWDGSGYPDGLSGEEIDILGRIYAVADVFDALITDRPYRAGLSRAEVVDYITEKSGKQFDPKVVEALLRVLEGDKEDPNKKSLRGSPLLTT
jgi:putative nucleotidyltransferase with HDIG domain